METAVSVGCSSKSVRVLNHTMASPGIALGSMSHRRTCRQSTFTIGSMISGKRSAVGATPSSKAFAISPAFRPMAAKFGMEPPTMPVPIKVSNGPYTGAVDTAAMSRAASRGTN